MFSDVRHLRITVTVSSVSRCTLAAFKDEAVKDVNPHHLRNHFFLESVVGGQKSMHVTCVHILIYLHVPTKKSVYIHIYPGIPPPLKQWWILFWWIEHD